MQKFASKVRSRLIGVLAILAVVTAGFTVGSVLTPDEPAEAANAALFNPGYIISDSLFYTANAMSEAQIQAFLESAAPGACGPSSCLKQFRMDTASKAQYYSDSSGRVECTAYQGAAGESAARIIYKVQQACGISAKVILVTLQKERGSVTKTHPIPADFTVAMGFGCPDTAACDTTYYGFQNQVWMAARQFKAYRAAPTFFNHRAGATINVRIHPNPDCGTWPVYIANAATAALYNYTPYQPNAAALANLYGSGDACSSYGNRNFWAYYTDWFGSPIGQVDPIGNFESAVSSEAGKLTIRGWAFDYDTTNPISVHVYVDGAFAWGGPANVSRGDVQRAYPSQSGNHGFQQTLSLNPGTRNVCVYGINQGYGQNSLISCRTVTVAAPAADGRLDSVTPGVGSVEVRGWAFDQSNDQTTSVHVYVNGSFAAGFPANASRPDVAKAFPGKSANHGYLQTIPMSQGTHSVCVYGLTANKASSKQLGCRSVTVQTNAPRGLIDSATGTAGGVQLRGWAFDPATPEPVSVHVYVNGAFASGFPANVSRGDVQRVYPAQGANHGFDWLIPAASGSRQVCVFALNSAKNANTALGCRTVAVP